VFSAILLHFARGSGRDQLLCVMTKLPASFHWPAPRFDFLCPTSSDLEPPGKQKTAALLVYKENGSFYGDLSKWKDILTSMSCIGQIPLLCILKQLWSIGFSMHVLPSMYCTCCTPRWQIKISTSHKKVFWMKTSACRDGTLKNQPN